MKVGDLIRCGEELGVILDFDSQPPGVFDDDVYEWINVFWQDGDIEGISIEDVDELVNESR